MLPCTLATQHLMLCLTSNIAGWLCFGHTHSDLLLAFIPQEDGFCLKQNFQAERINLLCAFFFKGFLRRNIFVS